MAAMLLLLLVLLLLLPVGMREQPPTAQWQPQQLKAEKLVIHQPCNTLRFFLVAALQITTMVLCTRTWRLHCHRQPQRSTRIRSCNNNLKQTWNCRWRKR